MATHVTRDTIPIRHFQFLPSTQSGERSFSSFHCCDPPSCDLSLKTLAKFATLTTSNTKLSQLLLFSPQYNLEMKFNPLLYVLTFCNVQRTRGFGFRTFILLCILRFFFDGHGFDLFRHVVFGIFGTPGFQRFLSY